jgi:hypothetical protein
MEDVEEGTEVAFEAVRELLISLEKPSCGGASGWTPKHTGLEMMTSKDGTTAWVSEVRKTLKLPHIFCNFLNLTDAVRSNWDL